MLAESGKHQTINGGPFGWDFLAIRSMLEVAKLTGWSVYLWDPETSKGAAEQRVEADGVCSGARQRLDAAFSGLFVERGAGAGCRISLS